MSGHATTAARLALGAAGLAAAGYGVLRLLGTGRQNVLATVPWLLGVVLAHDAVLAPLVLATVAGGVALLPSWARAPAAGVLVVLGSTTLLAVPVLGRFGAKPDNPTLLDRDYVGGWAVLAGIVVLGGVVAAGLARRSRRGPPGSAGRAGQGGRGG